MCGQFVCLFSSFLFSRVHVITGFFFWHHTFGLGLRQFSFKVMHRIITIKKELQKYKLASNDKCPSCFNPDSIVQTFIHCQESTEFFSKNLGCFNDYHKENVKLSNKQNLFNTFEDSFPWQMSNPVHLNRLRLLVLLQKKYLRKLLEQCRIESCGKQH